jgi:hypothetical protein
MSWFSEVFSGGVFKSIENIATEFIETNKETAEAKAVMVKALDPNGRMRRDLTRFICYMYGTYLIVMLLLLTFEFFGFVPQGQTPAIIANVTTKLTNTFTPVSTAFGLIVSASFGVNFYNVKKEK